jgi:hypothetical protein
MKFYYLMPALVPDWMFELVAASGGPFGSSAAVGCLFERSTERAL